MKEKYTVCYMTNDKVISQYDFKNMELACHSISEWKLKSTGNDAKFIENSKEEKKPKTFWQKYGCLYL